MRKKLRGALIGCGHISGFHLKAWQQIPSAEIVALCDLLEERAWKRGAAFGIKKVYSDVHELMEKEALHFIDIATGPEAHTALVLEGFAHGLHILCQKPLASCVEEATRMVQLTQTHNRILMVHENWRWRRWYRELKRLLQRGTIGKVHYARIHSHYDALRSSPLYGKRTLLEQQPYLATRQQLILLEYGVHLVDLFRFLFGEPQYVFARAAHVQSQVKGEDLAVILLRRQDLLGTIDLSWAAIGEPQEALIESISVEGNRGTFELNRRGVLHCWTRKSKRTLRFFDGNYEKEYLESFRRTQAHFIDCIHRGRQPETSAADNRQTLQIIMTAYQSLDEQRELRLD